MSTRRFVIIAAVALIGVLPAPVLAQQGGIKAGVNFATLSDADEEFPGNSPRIGLLGGGWLRTPERSGLSFQVEALFSEKGIRIDIEEEGISIGGDIRLRYIEVPVMARLDLGAPGARTRVYLLGGGAPAFNIGARVKGEAEGEEETMDISDEIKAFDLGVVAAAGIEFGRALIEARYTHGLTNINADSGDGQSVKNRVFSVMLGFRLK